jgi:hypothetical protein
MVEQSRSALDFLLVASSIITSMYESKKKYFNTNKRAIAYIAPYIALISWDIPPPRGSVSKIISTPFVVI